MLLHIGYSIYNILILCTRYSSSKIVLFGTYILTSAVVYLVGVGGGGGIHGIFYWMLLPTAVAQMESCNSHIHENLSRPISGRNF